MEKIFEDAGIDYRLHVVDAIEKAKKNLNCIEFSVIPGGNDTVILTLHSFRVSSLGYRKIIFPYLTSTHGITSFVLRSVRGINVSEIEIDMIISLSSADTKSTLSWNCSLERADPVFFKKRWEELSVQKKVSMPRLLFDLIEMYSSKIVNACQEALHIELEYLSGDSSCVVSYLGMSRCDAGFLEKLLFQHGRYVNEVFFTIDGLKIEFDTKSNHPSPEIRNSGKRSRGDE